jgi:hypothetical protein
MADDIVRSESNSNYNVNRDEVVTVLGVKEHGMQRK